METSQVRRYGILIALVVLVNAGMVCAQSNDTPTADGPVRENMFAFIKDTSTGCNTFTRHEYGYRERGEEEPDAASYAVWGKQTMRVSVTPPSQFSVGPDRTASSMSEGINDQRPSTNGLMVAEVMQCRQCRGKCAALNLQCRSQCLSDSACLVLCQEQSSQCETTCKQIFQCE